jgi:hypothetical protein
MPGFIFETGIFIIFFSTTFLSAYSAITAYFSTGGAIDSSSAAALFLFLRRAARVFNC